MDGIIITQRLKLVLVNSAPLGSREFGWLHELHSNEKAMWWSIYGRSKTIADTEKRLEAYLPTPPDEEKSYRVAYAVHEITKLEDGQVSSTRTHSRVFGEGTEVSTRFIGLVNVKSLERGALALPENLTLPASATSSTLTVELAYSFLPNAWGKGYATEAVQEVFSACRSGQPYWHPYGSLYVRAIVNQGNPPSLRVMKKVGMEEKGVFHWKGERLFLAGEWREEDWLHIFGTHLLD